MRKIFGACALVALAACGSMERAAAPADMSITDMSITDMSIEVGKPFPNIVLPALADGRPASVATFRGKKILLHVFASW